MDTILEFKCKGPDCKGIATAIVSFGTSSVHAYNLDKMDNEQFRCKCDVEPKHIYKYRYEDRIRNNTQ